MVKGYRLMKDTKVLVKVRGERQSCTGEISWFESRGKVGINPDPGIINKKASSITLSKEEKTREQDWN